jgi:hypothetical protein
MLVENSKSLLLILLAIALGCKSQQEVSRVPDPGKNAAPAAEVGPADAGILTSSDPESVPNGDGILFLGFNIELDTISGAYKIALADMKLREGRLKQSGQSQARADQSNILCTLYDSNETSLYQLTTVNPLIQNLEYPNDDGSLGRVTFFNSEGFLMLRVPYNRNYHHISFDRIVDPATSERIGSITLNIGQ